MIGCSEEVAFQRGYISADQLAELAHEMHASRYGQYLLQVLQESGERA